MKKLMLTSVLVLMLGGVASAISWIDVDTPTGYWRVTPSSPDVSDQIDFSGPLSQAFTNYALAEVEAGGIPTISIDNSNKTIELWFEPPPPINIPYLYHPICGLEGNLGSLEAGNWIFFGNNPVANFSISFDVYMSDFLCGDVTGNGDVTSYDAALVAQYAVGLIDWFTEEQILAADVDCDGSVTSEDALLIADYAIGSIDEFPCDCTPPPCSAPYVIALPATDITSTSATLWGRIEDDGGCRCQYRFRYRADSESENVYTNWTGSVTTGETFSQTISGLKPDSKYYFSIQAKNSGGQSSWALSKNFTTTGGDGYTFSDDFNDGVLDQRWKAGNMDWIEESNGELRFHGTTEQSGWGVGGSHVSVDSFCEGDFDISVDFRIPRFDGSGTRLIYLQAHSWDEMTGWEQTVGIFYSYGFGYRVQSWNPSQFSNWLQPFGNERTSFHKMRLIYDSQTETVRGYVDDTYVGSLSAKMDGDLTFTLCPATETQGMIIDARYDNFCAKVCNNSSATNGLVAHWKLDEATGTIAHDAIGSHHGTLYGNPQWLPEYGIFDGALWFDGNGDYVDTGYTENLATWTISTWVSSPWAPLGLDPTGPVHREKNYQINWDHSFPVFRGAAVLNVNGTWYAASFGLLEADTWYHLAASYDGEVLRSYKNGVPVTTNVMPSGNPAIETASLKLGKHALYTAYFTGTIDDVRIYDKVLTAGEIAALAQ